jgi:septum formation protein
VIAPDEHVECGVCSETGPAELVAELATRKAAAVIAQVAAVPRYPGSYVLGADTVAECDGFILGKPRNEAEAAAMLRRLSGREHRVYSGVCLWPVAPSGQPCTSGKPDVRVAITRLRMDPLSDEQLGAYLASGQWEGKAGAFGYQDRLGWVHILEGSESNVVGLPMELVEEMIRGAGGC